jgi:hypothetical protein
MGRCIDDLALLVAAMARDHPVDSVAYPRDQAQFLILKPVELGAAFSPDSGFAPASRQIGRVFAERTQAFAD